MTKIIPHLIVHVLEYLWECCRRKHTPHRLLVGPDVVVVDLVGASLSALRLALLPAPLTSISKDQIVWPVQKVAGSAPGRRDASQIAQLRGALESSEIFRYALR